MDKVLIEIVVCCGVLLASLLVFNFIEQSKTKSNQTVIPSDIVQPVCSEGYLFKPDKMICQKTEEKK